MWSTCRSMAGHTALGLAAFVALCLALAVSFAWLCFVAWIVVASLGAFGLVVPFWPTVGVIFVLGLLLGGGR